MARNNDVFQVLIPDPTVAILAAGNTQDALTEGQIGVFDSDTNISIDGSTPVRNFFIAVGVSSDGSGNVDTLRKSAGQLVQSRNMQFYSFRPHTAALPMVVEINNYKNVVGGQDYTIKLEFRNQEIYRRIGFNQFSKPYSVRLNCPSGEAGNPNKLTKELVGNINGDVDQLVTAEAIATEVVTILAQGTAVDYAIGDVISAADLDVLIAYNEAEATPATYVSTGIRLTTNPIKLKSYGTINVSYYNPKQTSIIVSLIEDLDNGGFNCIGTVATTQEPAFEEGTGYVLQQKEYQAGGWNGNPGPYRVNQSTGLARGIDYQARLGAKYNTIALTYDQFSEAGWLEHLNNLATIVAFETTSGGLLTGQTGFLTVMDAILTPLGFDALADDAAAASGNPAVVEPTSGAATQDLDGIG